MSHNLPIKEISTYCGRNWQFVARVTLKSQMRTFNNAAKKGQLFNVDLLDKDGGEVRATFFNKAAEKFSPLLEQGKVYRFSKGQIKVANKAYSTLKHNYEITFEEDSLIEEVTTADAAEIATEMRFNFTRIRDLSSRSMPCTVDLIGVVKDVRVTSSVQTKQGDSLLKKLITLVDMSGCAVDVTLFGDHATKFDESTAGDAAAGSNRVLTFKGVSVKEYNSSRSASTLASTIMVWDPTYVPETAELMSWYATNKDAPVMNLSASAGGGRNSLGGMSGTGGPGGAGVKECDLATLREDCQNGFIPSTGGLTFSVNSAFLMNISTRTKDQELPIFYSACTTCNRKLGTDDRCVSCDKLVVQPNLRFLLRAQLADFSDDLYLSVFHDQALTLLAASGAVAQAAINPKDFAADAGDKLKSFYLNKIFNLKVRATASEYKGEIKPKITVVQCEPVEFKTDAHRMLKLLKGKIGEDTAASVTAAPSVGESRKRKIDEIADENEMNQQIV
jgi:replication factor A1